MNQGDLSNQQWEKLKPLLPPLKPRTGKPNHDHRQVVNGILWILRTGAPWRDLPERYGKWQSVATRFYRWQKAQIWPSLLESLQGSADQQGKIDWEVPDRRWQCDSCPSTCCRRKKGGQALEKLGRSRGGFSTKRHIRCEGKGKPMTFLLSPGQRHESLFLEELMEQGAVKRSGPGRPRLRPVRLVGDKGYTGRRIRNYLSRRGIRLTIPRLSNEPRRGSFSREIYRQRNIVERAINRLKQWRRIATRN